MLIINRDCQKERDRIAADLDRLEKEELERLTQQRELQREKQARRGWQWLAFLLGAIASCLICMKELETQAQ
ncbi:hypothetical protein [Nostoc sp. CCY0012]|uniref:hypothetical protein n=1 Tax=Nostoc sp. CCY0012 TaxID=1056123 RepID=UPI0039C5B1B1